MTTTLDIATSSATAIGDFMRLSFIFQVLLLLTLGIIIALEVFKR